MCANLGWFTNVEFEEVVRLRREQGELTVVGQGVTAVGGVHRRAR